MLVKSARVLVMKKKIKLKKKNQSTMDQGPSTANFVYLKRNHPFTLTVATVIYTAIKQNEIISWGTAAHLFWNLLVSHATPSCGSQSCNLQAGLWLPPVTRGLAGFHLEFDWLPDVVLWLRREWNDWLSFQQCIEHRLKPQCHIKWISI